MQNKEPIYAGFFVRLAAFLIDSLLVGGVLLAVRLPFAIMSLTSPQNILVRDFIFQYSVMDIVLYLAGCAYFILMTYYSGATLGKKLMHIKVISCEDRELTFFEVAFRETIGRFLSETIANAGYIMVAVDKHKRGFHDILSDTRVVYEHPKPSYVTPMQPRPMARPVYNPGTGMIQQGGMIQPPPQNNIMGGVQDRRTGTGGFGGQESMVPRDVSRTPYSAGTSSVGTDMPSYSGSGTSLETTSRAPQEQVRPEWAEQMKGDSRHE